MPFYAEIVRFGLILSYLLFLEGAGELKQKKYVAKFPYFTFGAAASFDNYMNIYKC